MSAANNGRLPCPQGISYSFSPAAAAVPPFKPRTFPLSTPHAPPAPGPAPVASAEFSIRPPPHLLLSSSIPGACSSTNHHIQPFYPAHPPGLPPPQHRTSHLQTQILPFQQTFAQLTRPHHTTAPPSALSADVESARPFTTPVSNFESAISNSLRTGLSSGGSVSFSGSHSSGGSGGKEKTPMCQVAELARFNKLCHQYRLVNESGPAHQKNFTVILTLREGEEYSGEGPSIKKAQQNAARRALVDTQLSRPLSHRRWWKPNNQPHVDSTLTPTVLLNALAHERGMVPVYKTIVDHTHPSAPAFVHFRQQPGHARFYHHTPLRPHIVSLRLGSMEFIGHGSNKQLARHDCASHALAFLNSQTPPNHQQKEESSEGQVQSTSSSERRLSNEEAELEMNKQLTTKSPISLVHELALRKKMDVHFEILSEVGPAHNRNYVVSCTVTDNPVETIVAEGQGGSKKQAKHEACKEMIELMKKSGPLPITGPDFVPKPRPPKETRRKTIVKDVKIDPDYGQQINPVSRLIQIQQARKEPEPRFEFISESGQARCKEFLMQVTIGDHSCRGTGPNKKLAKRAAAEVMLDVLGYAKSLPKPGKSVLKQSSIQSNSSDVDPEAAETQGDDEECQKEEGTEKSNGEEGIMESVENPGKSWNEEARSKRKVSFKLDCNFNAEQAILNEWYAPGSPHSNLVSGFVAPSRKSRNPVPHNQEMAIAAKQALDTLMKQPQNSHSESEEGQSVNGEVCAKQHLQFLAGICGFRVEFTDFPKTLREDGTSEYLTLVSLGISPPHVCNGAGPSSEVAQNEAALSALKALAETNQGQQALNGVTPVLEDTEENSGPETDPGGSVTEEFGSNSGNLEGAIVVGSV